MSNQDPDLFNSVDEDIPGNVGDEGYVANDEPMGAHAHGTTSAEELAGETFADRDKHTVPEVTEDDIHEETELVGRIVDKGDEDVDDVDDEAAAVAREDAMAEELSAEESAMHITDEP